MKDKSERKITDLPPELALNICKYIADRDILNAVKTIPTWRWITSSTWFNLHLSRRILHWQWIDRFIIKCLFPQSSSDSYRDSLAAFEYRTKQDEFYSAKSFLPQHRPIKTCLQFTVYPLLFKHTRIDYSQVNAVSANARLCEVALIPGERLHSSMKLQANSNSDGIIYFADLTSSCIEELAYFIDHLSPHQSLAIVIIKDIETDTRTDFACLMDFLNHLEENYKTRLFRSLAHWRLWCLHKGSEKFINMVEVIAWLRVVSLWRRKQSGRWKTDSTAS